MPDIFFPFNPTRCSAPLTTPLVLEVSNIASNHFYRGLCYILRPNNQKTKLLSGKEKDREFNNISLQL